MNDQGMLKPALIGGVLLGILSALPIVSLFNCVCCAWVIGGGVLAAYLFVKSSLTPVTLGRGAALGLLTGVIGTLAHGLLSVPLYFLVNRGSGGLLEQMRQVFDQVPNMPPETRQALEALLAQKEFGALFFVFGLIFSLIINCLFAMLGGTTGVAIFEKRKSGNISTGTQTLPPPPDLPPLT